jgi:2-keto-4-pentenoate hydratase/2-oxohepta-3-ene-1,7-dioic acid hydratase in catechol pathway
MRLASIRSDRGETAAVVLDEGVIAVARLAADREQPLPATLSELIAGSHLPALVTAVTKGPLPELIPHQQVSYAPGKIWGIGLNYREHARDLDVSVPTHPASFMKPATAIIGLGDAICLPPESQRVTAEAELGVIIGRRCQRVTAEAELGVIIGRRCHRVNRDEAQEAILGFTCVLDMTAEDILRQNPRFLTRAKSFDTFFSFGPVVLTPDEVPDLDALVVRTIVNGEVRAENTVSNMTFDLLELIRFHSQGMTLEPGDVISTGTPGAWPIQAGDVVRCEITGFPPLENHVQAPAPERKDRTD